MPYDAIIFDLDGTLIDSERIALEAGRIVLARRGLNLSDALFGQLVGTASDTGKAILRDTFGPLDFDAIDAEWGAEHQRLSRSGIPLHSGAERLVRALAAQGLPMAIATSSHRVSALRKLENTGLAAAFVTVVTRDCVRAPKPAPEAYLLAAQRLSVAPDRCLAFEDSNPGAESAFAAGMRVVQVPDLVRSEGRHAHHLAPDLISGARAAGLAID